MVLEDSAGYCCINALSVVSYTNIRKVSFHNTCIIAPKKSVFSKYHYYLYIHIKSS